MQWTEIVDRSGLD